MNVAGELPMSGHSAAANHLAVGPIPAAMFFFIRSIQ